MLRGKKEFPKGLIYQPDFITIEEENSLLQFIQDLDFDQVIMHDKVARRTVKHYGYKYLFSSGRAKEGEPIPDSLLWLRDRSAKFAHIPQAELEEMLITKYPEKATIGWHRDAPMFGSKIIGISLLSSCRMCFQNKSNERKVFEQELLPRSIYVLSGPARFIWQHSIPAVKDLRYSITFRTVNKKWIIQENTLSS